LFQCDTCPVADHLELLDSDNKRAWDTTTLVASRFLAEGQAAGPVLVRLLNDLDEDDFADMLRRITVIYDTIAPRPDKS
jgi:hypothetical protein